MGLAIFTFPLSPTPTLHSFPAAPLRLPQTSEYHPSAQMPGVSALSLTRLQLPVPDRRATPVLSNLPTIQSFSFQKPCLRSHCAAIRVCVCVCVCNVVCVCVCARACVCAYEFLLSIYILFIFSFLFVCLFNVSGLSAQSIHYYYRYYYKISCNPPPF